MQPRMNPRTLGMSTNLSPAEIAQTVQILAETVPTRERSKGMYLTDLVSITVLTTVSGAAYIMMFDMTAKKPRNFDGDEARNEIKRAAPVTAAGYAMVFKIADLSFANMKKIIQYANSRAETRALTGIRAVFPGVAKAYEIHSAHWHNVAMYGKTEKSPVERVLRIERIVGSGDRAIEIPAAVPSDANIDVTAI
jgi:heme/copper-type cytochrome/quinol oxidase subunit 2